MPTPAELNDVPVEEIIIKPVQSAVKTTIDSEEFKVAFAKEMKAGPAWRTPASLATKLGVDAVDLVKWMDRIQNLTRKPGKEDGIFYYGIAPKEEEKETKKLTRPIVTEEDRYCAAILHSIYGQYVTALEKYGLRIYDKSPEAFAALMNARDRLSAGTVLFHNVTKVDASKLPKL